jgi:Cd2+/Zn2+-exporting ATPase
VNQAPITGESLPVEKSPEDFVYAGSINQNGSLEVQVRKKSQDTMLARIIHLVEEAQTQKAPVQQFVEKFARYYTPTVVIIAILFATIPPLLFGGTISDWFYKALVLLVISCPCALVISTPVTIVSGLTNASRKGILIKGGMYLENFDKIKILAFDKTGTLTTGQPSVKSIKVINGYTEEKLLQIAVSLEAHSNHPLGKAILNYGTERQIEQVPVKNFVSFTGKGARGIINGETYYIGNHRLFEEKGMCEEDIHNELDKLENRSHTAILIGNEKNIVGLIAVADKIRESAPLAIKNLKNAGIKKTVMLTGDNGITAESISNEIGIDQFYAELLPEDKVRLIHQFIEDNKNVGMVGDGINDAPALAAASMGISMGASGSDTAIETADITLMKDDLKKLSYLKRLSHKTNFIIKQNIFIALFLKAIFFTLAIPGLTTLWMAVFADMGASLIVIFNGLRTLRFNQSDGTKPTLPK